MSEGAPKWTQWWQDDLPCQFTKEQAVENAAFLMRVLGKEVFVNTRFDGWRNHPLLVRWQSAGAGSFLELNVLADDIRQVEQVEGLDRCLSDLRDRNRFFSSRHTLHSAALFARSGKATVHSFLHDDAPDFLLECDNQMISVEAKLLERVRQGGALP